VFIRRHVVTDMCAIISPTSVTGTHQSLKLRSFDKTVITERPEEVSAGGGKVGRSTTLSLLDNRKCLPTSLDG
jgi:hypothetical protein